jgi:hypothetical protein
MKQLFPLYFENFVEPGQRMTRTVGKVWFTIEARVWNKENLYTVADNLSPITNTSINIENPKGFHSLPIFDQITVPHHIYQSGSGLIVGSKYDNPSKRLEALVSGSEIRSYGWYFDTAKTLSIRGGPKACSFSDNDNIVQYLDLNSGHQQFVIQEVDDYYDSQIL